MKIIGHRGARGLAPENTLEAIHKALEHHVDEIEVDLRVTKDNIVVLHHDKHLTDPNGRKRRISKYKYAELKKHKPDLAGLQELLHVSDKTPLYLEVKAREKTKPIIQRLKEVDHSRISLASKDQKVLLALHKSLPEIPKIVIHPWSGAIATRRAKQVATKRISMNQLWLWRGFIKPMSRRGWQLSAYTLNNPVKASRWQKYGLYGVVTDYPDLFDK